MYVLIAGRSYDRNLEAAEWLVMGSSRWGYIGSKKAAQCVVAPNVAIPNQVRSAQTAIYPDKEAESEMLARLKRHPLIGLALAIAAGYVLAHVVNEIGDYLWLSFIEDFLRGNGWMVTDLAVAAGLLSLIIWKSRGILGWRARHKRGLAFSFFAVLCVFAALIARTLLVR